MAFVGHDYFLSYLVVGEQVSANMTNRSRCLLSRDTSLYTLTIERFYFYFYFFLHDLIIHRQHWWLANWCRYLS